MKRQPDSKHKPTLSRYQLSQRKNAVLLVLLFTVTALALAAAFYFYQKQHSLVP